MLLSWVDFIATPDSITWYWGSSKFTLSSFNKLRERKTFSPLQYIWSPGKYLGPAWIMCLSFGPIILDVGGEVLWLIRPRLNDHTWVGVGGALNLTESSKAQRSGDPFPKRNKGAIRRGREKAEQTIRSFCYGTYLYPTFRYFSLLWDRELFEGKDCIFSI